MISGSLADIFLHNPRGSNNKLNEQNDNRANGNRLFEKVLNYFFLWIIRLSIIAPEFRKIINFKLSKDSQNNGRGGYNVADKYAQAASSEDEQHKPVYFQSGHTGDSKLLVEWWSQENFERKICDDF